MKIMTTTIDQTQANATHSAMTMPGLLLRLEGLAALLTALALYHQIGGNWLMFVLLMLAPDLAMIGYLVNARVGSLTYNVVHHYGLPLALGLGSLAGSGILGLSLALIWAAHI